MNARMAIAVPLLAAAAGVSAQQAELIGLGFLPNGTASFGTAISADGTTVVGMCETTAPTVKPAFRWTRAGGMQNLGPVGFQTMPWASAVSGDGSVVVGDVCCYPPTGGSHSWRWTAATGMQDVHAAPHPYSFANGVSADGSVVVGGMLESGSGQRMFRWTAATGMVPVGATLSANAYAANADGSVLVGTHNFSGTGSHMMRWTEAGGYEDLGSLGGSSSARAVSADGNVVVGIASLGNIDWPLRWTAAGGLQNLGQLTPNAGAGAYAVSGDGRVVVGRSGMCCNDTYEAFIWTEKDGMRALVSYLAQLGVNTQGWRLHGVSGISHDGRVLTGTGKRNGMFEAWVAVLPGACYADCNGDGALNLGDFGCFQTKFALGDPYADCNADGTLNLGDFGCFQTKFALGCP